MARATAGKVSAAKPTAGRGGVVWTKRQRARLFGSLHPQPGDPAAPTREAAWRGLCDLYGAPEVYALPDEADRRAEKVLGELRAEFRGAPRTSTPGRELLRLGLLMNEGESSTDYYKNVKAVTAGLVEFWVSHAGLEFASRVVWTPGECGGGVRCGDARRAFVAKGSVAGEQALGRTELWWLHLRRAILAASPAVYEDTRRVWLGAGADKFVVAATFCRAPDEAHALVAKELARKSVGYGSIVLLSALTDPQLALRFARAQPLNYACGAEFHAFALVDNLGAAAAPVLLALLERVSSGTDARRALAAAAVLADPAACKAALRGLAGPAATSLATALK